MRVLEASERSIVDIPLSEFLGDEGQLKIRPDLIGKGLVEVRQTNDVLKLRVNGLIGRLPVTSNLVLDVQPKFSINNLNRIVYTSRIGLSNPFFLDRPYEQTTSEEYLPVPLIQSFSKALERLILQGLLREYIHEIVDSSPKPKINFIKSQQKFWSKLDPTKAVIERFNYCINNLPNQCLKLAAMKALSLSKSTEQLKELTPTLAASLRQLENVDFKSPQELANNLVNVRSSIPSFRKDYVRALTLALEIIRNTDVSLNSTTKGLALESYIISLDEVFEQYIRNVIFNIKKDDMSLVTVDGNKKRHQKPLFFDNNKYRIKPDLIVKNGPNITMIGDVKYKIRAKEEDRYQIISHSLSYCVNKAILIYPRRTPASASGVQRLGGVGTAEKHITIYEYYFDLAGDLRKEEEELRQAILKLNS